VSEPAGSVRAQGVGEPLVRLEDVHKWFGNLHVLKGVDLTMQQRDVVVVIGPSGGGKSTLLRSTSRTSPTSEPT
jgi:glutamate transport system ATP-binding protein